MPTAGVVSALTALGVIASKSRQQSFLTRLLADRDA
jgi:hypothetical protein